MKNRLIFTILTVCVTAILVGCNEQIIDTIHSYNYGYILLPNGECIEGEVESWKDFSDGDQIQVKINGVTYLTDTTRCVLINK